MAEFKFSAPLQPLDVVEEDLLHFLHPLPLGVPAHVEDQQLAVVHVPVVRIHHALVKEVSRELVHGKIWKERVSRETSKTFQSIWKKVL